MTSSACVLMECSSGEQPVEILLCLNDLRKTGQLCDIRVRCDTADESSPIPAHRCILAASSAYFMTLFNCGLRDANTPDVTVPFPSHVVCRMIDFMYTGKIEMSLTTVEETLRLADFLGMSKVIQFCFHVSRDLIWKNPRV